MRFASQLSVLILLISCGQSHGIEEDASTRDFGRVDTTVDGRVVSGSRGYVFDVMDTPSLSGGISVGRNLDGVVTRNGDLTGCGKPDLVHPDGTPGVDNAMAQLVPIFDTTMRQSVSESFIQRIAEGAAILLLELDGSGNGTMGMGSATERRPRLTATGRLAPNQAFEAGPQVGFTGTHDGDTFIAEIEALEIFFPIGADLATFRLNGVVLEAETIDGVVQSGVIAGSLPTEQLVEAFETSDIDTMGIQYGPIFQGQADLNPNRDGVCEAISIVIQFHAVPAALR